MLVHSSPDGAYGGLPLMGACFYFIRLFDLFDEEILEDVTSSHSLSVFEFLNNFKTSLQTLFSIGLTLALFIELPNC